MRPARVPGPREDGCRRPALLYVGGAPPPGPGVLVGGPCRGQPSASLLLQGNPPPQVCKSGRFPAGRGGPGGSGSEPRARRPQGSGAESAGGRGRAGEGGRAARTPRGRGPSSASGRQKLRHQRPGAWGDSPPPRASRPRLPGCPRERHPLRGRQRGRWARFPAGSLRASRGAERWGRRGGRWRSRASEIRPHRPGGQGRLRAAGPGEAGGKPRLLPALGTFEKLLEMNNGVLEAVSDPLLPLSPPKP